METKSHSTTMPADDCQIWVEIRCASCNVPIQIEVDDLDEICVCSEECAQFVLLSDDVIH